MPVDHSIPGVDAFILHTSSGSIANTGDLRFHGRRKDDTEKFVERCGESSLDLILCEGTRINQEPSLTEYDVESISTKIIDVTGKSSVESKGEIPPRSVVIPGSYPKSFPAGEYGVPCALIIGKRKESTDKKTSLNNALRDYSISV